MTAIFLERPLMPLPQPVRPFPSEDVSSYIERLAYANRLNPDALRKLITGAKRTKDISLDTLALLAGVPGETLRHALVDPGREPAPKWYEESTPCRLCAAIWGATERYASCWRPIEKVICLHHRRWIGPPGGDKQPALDRQPEILRAYRRHLRLVARFGREEAGKGFHIAAGICREWHDRRRHNEELEQRLIVFHGPEWRLTGDDPTVHAARYPQAVALARMLTSPYWKALAVTSSPAGQAAFAQEMRRTVSPSYQWPQPRDSRDPLYQWLIAVPQFGKARRRTGAPSPFEVA